MTVTATAPDTLVVPSRTEVRSAGRLLNAAIVVLLCAWVLVPIYLLLVNTLSSPQEVTAFPKTGVPSFDMGSINFAAARAM